MTQPQAGFINHVNISNAATTGFTSTLTTDQATSSTLTVSDIPGATGTSASGLIEARNRASTTTASTFPYPAQYNLLTSFLSKDNRNPSNMAGLSFALTNLLVNQHYTVNVFSDDPGVAGQGSGTTRWSIQNGDPVNYTLSTRPDGPTKFNLTGRSDGLGNLTFSGINTGNGIDVVVNGFALVATPEPSTSGLACCGAVGLGVFASIRSARRPRSVLPTSC